MYRSRFVLLTQVGWPWPAHQAFQRRSCVSRVFVVSRRRRRGVWSSSLRPRAVAVAPRPRHRRRRRRRLSPSHADGVEACVVLFSLTARHRRDARARVKEGRRHAPRASFPRPGRANRPGSPACASAPATPSSPPRTPPVTISSSARPPARPCTPPAPYRRHLTTAALLPIAGAPSGSPV